MLSQVFSAFDKYVRDKDGSFTYAAQDRLVIKKYFANDSTDNEKELFLSIVESADEVEDFIHEILSQNGQRDEENWFRCVVLL